MTRLFSQFPGGRPGLGLLVLRATVAGLVTLELGASEAWHGVPDSLLGMGRIAGALSILAGAFTPIGSPVVAVVAAAGWWRASPVAFPQVALAAATAGTAVGLFLLGPGAYSIDAHLFGRREIVIPPDDRQ